MSGQTVIDLALGSDGGLSGASFSPCRRYRYTLTRTWGDGARRMVVIGLNPSTADEVTDDPTIRRCIAFAKREGCDGLVMLNLFAFRATDPAEMKNAEDPVGPKNDAILRDYARLQDAVLVAAWGTHGAYRGRGDEVAEMLPGLLCFGTTKHGHPKHPLYLRADTPLVPYLAPDPTTTEER